MSYKYYTLFVYCASLSFFWGASIFAEEDISQLTFSELQSQASSLIDKGYLLEAQPLLRELISRAEGAENNTVPLDLPYYFSALAHVQIYNKDKEESQLEDSLSLLNRLVDNYPNCSKLKDSLLLKVSVLSMLGKKDDSINLMTEILSRKYAIKLNKVEEIQILKDLVKTYYNSPNWLEGIRTYKKFMIKAQTNSDKYYAAAALFEAYIEKEKLDDAKGMLTFLARDSKIRYMPRLNISLLKACDLMSANGRLNDAAVILSLLKTKSEMLAYHKKTNDRNKKALEILRKSNKSPDKIQKIELALKQGEQTVKSISKLPALENELCFDVHAITVKLRAATKHTGYFKDSCPTIHKRSK